MPSLDVTVQQLHDPNGYSDWVDVFHYANGSEASPCAVLGDSSSDAKFDRADVEHVEAASEGENDGDHWLIVGRLRDGRWFSVKAWCDYTGWG